MIVCFFYSDKVALEYYQGMSTSITAIFVFFMQATMQLLESPLAPLHIDCVSGHVIDVDSRTALHTQHVHGSLAQGFKPPPVVSFSDSPPGICGVPLSHF